MSGVFQSRSGSLVCRLHSDAAFNSVCSVIESRQPARQGHPVGYISLTTGLIFLIQHLSLGPVVTRHLLAMSVCRLILDALMVTVLSRVLGRWAKALLTLCVSGLGLGIVLYAKTFHQPLSIYPLLFDRTMPGHVLWAVLSMGLGWWTPVLLALGALGAWFGLRARSSGRKPWGRAAVVAALGYVLVFAAGWRGFSLGSSSSQSFDWHVSRRVAVVGLLPTWACQLARYARQSGDLCHYQPCDPGQIPGMAAAAEARPGQHMLVIQAESLDWNALATNVGGREVMPFLSRMAREAECRKHAAFTKAGSAGMDFAWLTGYEPDGPLRPSDLRDVPLTNGVPWLLAKKGFECVLIHGNTGEFYGRRFLWNRLPDATVLFAEEMDGIRDRSYWGARDRAVFQRSAEILSAAKRTQCHFIITLDTHGPYDLIDPSKAELFPGAGGLDERYLNSLHELDKNLQAYFEGIKAPYTAVVYGDHAARGRFRWFVPAREEATEYVPLIVWHRGAPP